MATLPPSTDITSSATTEGQAKAWLANVRTFIYQFLGSSGTQRDALTGLGAVFHASVAKTGTYTVVPTDRGKVLRCAGTFTLHLSAAATLDDGFCVEVINDGTGEITIDPNLSETIDGGTSVLLREGKSAVIFCDGTKFTTFGRGGCETFNGRDGEVTLTSGDVTGALGFTPANSKLSVLAQAVVSIEWYGLDMNGTPFCRATRANGATFNFQTGRTVQGGGE